MEDSKRELSAFRYEMSTEALTDAEIMFENERYKNTLNRGYYAIFHAIRSVNALDGYDSSKHSGVISYFNQIYVKSGEFPKQVSKEIKLASEHRENADYLDFYIASKDEAQKQIDRAKYIREYVLQYLKGKGVISSN